MDILEEDPVALIGAFLEKLNGFLLLALSHGEIYQCHVLGGLSTLLANGLDFLGRIDSGEENEENRSLRGGLLECLINTKRLGINILNAEVVLDEDLKSRGDSVWSHESNNHQFIEASHFFKLSGQLDILDFLLCKPLLPVKMIMIEILT